MNPEKIAKILASHRLWLASNEVSGGRANLRGADLEGVDLQGANLRGADLRGANLQRANFENADLKNAILEDADLKNANLRSADLKNANLRSADLRGADLRSADLENTYLRDADFRDAVLEGTNLRDANLRGADLEGADLRGANLRGAILDNADLEGAIFSENWQIVPPVGQSFTAFKKVRGEIVLELLIPRSARRTSSLIGRKCRADAALVVGVAYGDAVNNAGICKSLHDSRFTYEIGKMASEPSFDPDIRVECTAGIHFFMTKEEAFNYKF